jgi:uncharacterized damage-inducible protein DinB
VFRYIRFKGTIIKNIALINLLLCESNEYLVSALNQFNIFAKYNKLMNQRIMDSASQLSNEDLTSDRGAFFKSVIGTLNHILVGDIIWLKRFSSNPAGNKLLGYINRIDPPASLNTILFEDLNELKAERERIDELIIDWIAKLSESDIENNISYQNMAGEPQNKLLTSLISHLFLHQVHHRGQATTLISQSGVDFGDTDIIEIIADRFA